MTRALAEENNISEIQLSDINSAQDELNPKGNIFTTDTIEKSQDALQSKLMAGGGLAARMMGGSAERTRTESNIHTRMRTESNMLE